MLVFIGSWLRSELTAILAPIVLLLIAHRRGVWRMRRLYGITALVASVSVLFSLLAGERIPVTLVLQAQFWRALWIANVVAVVACADLAGQFVLRRRAPSRLPLVGALVPLASLLAQGSLLLLVWAGLMVCPRAYWQWFADQVLLHRRLVLGLLVAIVAVQLPAYLLSLSLASAAVDSSGGSDVAVGLLRTGGSGALALAIFLAACRWQPRVLAALALPRRSACGCGTSVRRRRSTGNRAIRSMAAAAYSPRRSSADVPFIGMMPRRGSGWNWGRRVMPARHMRQDWFFPASAPGCLMPA